MEEESGTMEELVQELQEISQQSPDLRQACRSLLEVLSHRFELGRAAILVRCRDHLDGVASGVDSSLLEELLRSAKEDEKLFPLAGWQGRITEPPSLSSEATVAAADREGFRIFPLEFPSSQFSATVLVDRREVGGWGEALLRSLQEIAPPLARMAEVEALRRELERERSRASNLATIFDSLPDPVLVMDDESRILVSNRRADELLITDQADSPGRRHAVETNNLYFSALRAREVLGEESRELILADPESGEDLLFEVTPLSPSTSAGVGESGSQHIYILRDITDLKQATLELEAQYARSVGAEHRARRESERLNVILANAGVPILVTDQQSDIILMNREAERLFELPTVEGPASPRFHELRANDTRITGLISDFLLQPHLRREEELELTDPDDARAFPARAVLTKITDQKGEPTAVVSVLHDLTEEMEVQRLADDLQQLNEELEVRIEKATRELSSRNRELEEQREKLAKASRLKTEFLAMMSHELRTPINSLLGYNSLLHDEILGELNERQKEALGKVRSSSEHLLSLINDILDLSKVEAGRISLNLEPVRIRDFLGPLSETLRPMANSKGIEFRVEVEKEVPPVRADPTRLRQILLNLTSNAVKFTDEGHVAVRVAPVDGGETVRFQVKDTGTGIKEEHQEQIFEEFRQVDPFTTRKHGGTGLGLTISRRLVELMDGRLSLESVYGEGSTFWFDLPAHRQAAKNVSRGTDGEET